jgi:hypothetical protein
MRALPRAVVSLSAVLVAAGCTDGREALAPTAAMRAEVLASPAQRIAATGTFEAQVDFSTITLQPRGRNCLLTVQGRLVFSGTIQGPATGHTDALEFAPCEKVAMSPPGTYEDEFHSELVFVGTVDGRPATANVRYVGRTAVGGHIDAHLIFSNGVEGPLDASAQVAVGGTYDGAVVVK